MARPSAWALLIALGCATPSLADTVWLNDQGEKNLAQIEAWIAPARAFELDRGGKKVHYLRGRIVEVTSDSQGTAVKFEAWSRPPGAKPTDPIKERSAPFVLSLSLVGHIDHEVDALVDFELMFSDRGQREPSNLPPWQRILGPLNKVLENPPEGTIDLNLDRKAAPAESPAAQGAVKVPGWILRYLVDPAPTPGVPTGGTAAQVQAVTLPDGRVVQAVVITPEEADPLHPRNLNMGIERAVQELLFGLAREHYLRGLRKDVNRDDFNALARQSIRFLSRFATLAAPDKFRGATSANLTGVGYRRRHYRDVGLAARDSVIRVLEAAAPGALAPGDFTPATRARLQAELAAFPDAIERAQFERRYAPLLAGDVCLTCQVVRDPAAPHTCAQVIAPEARLDVSPSSVAHEALSILIESPEWWAVHGNAPGSQEEPDANRLARAVLGLASFPRRPDGVLYPDPRRTDKHYMEVRAHEAPLLLVRFLRPSAALRVAEGPDGTTTVESDGGPDPAGWLPADPTQRKAMEDRLAASSRTFAAELSRQLTELDPGRREAAQRALQEGARIKGDPLVSEKVVENLLAVASAQIGVEAPSEESLEGAADGAPPGPTPAQPPAGNGGDWGSFSGGNVDRVDGLALNRDEAQQYLRARRRHAVRVLMILARLAERSDSEEERRLGAYVLRRLTDLRESIAEGRASQGEKSLIGVLNRLRRAPEPTLEREAAFLNTQLRDELQDRTEVVERQLEELRRELERAVTGRRDRDAERLRRECEERRRRIERLNRLRQK